MFAIDNRRLERYFEMIDFMDRLYRVMYEKREQNVFAFSALFNGKKGVFVNQDVFFISSDLENDVLFDFVHHEQGENQPFHRLKIVLNGLNLEIIQAPPEEPFSVYFLPSQQRIEAEQNERLFELSEVEVLRVSKAILKFLHLTEYAYMMLDPGDVDVQE